jgi:hypothetical protein
MVEEESLDERFILRPGLHFDPGPLALDLYRLLCIFLADRKVIMGRGSEI